MRYKITEHPDVPLKRKNNIVEADGFTRTSIGVTFHRDVLPDQAKGQNAMQKQEVAWFEKLGSIELADEEDDKTPPPLPAK